MTIDDRNALSRDVVVGFFDILTMCAGVANAEPQEALDLFDTRVREFVHDSDRISLTSAAAAEELLERAIFLATYGVYRYGKVIGTIAHATGVETVDLVRQEMERLLLPLLDEE